jgi:hypothetical protein
MSPYRYPLNRIDNNKKLLVEKLNGSIDSGKFVLDNYECVCCGSSLTNKLFSNDRYGVKQETVMCRECGLIYGNPRMNQKTLDLFYSSDIFRDIYHPVSNYERKWSMAENFELSQFDIDAPYDAFGFINFIEEEVDEYNGVFEIGAAGGANLRAFEKIGKKVAGFDLSPKMVKFATDKGLNVKLGDIKSVCGSWDIYIIQHVLEHIFNPVEFLKELHNKKANKLYIGVPGLIDLFPSVQSAHNYYFSPETLTEICRKSGYKLKNIKYYKSNNYIVSIFERSENEIKSTLVKSDEIKRAAKVIRKFKAIHTLVSLRKKLFELVGIKHD